MTDSGRGVVSTFLKEEIVGPRNTGMPLSIEGSVSFESREASRGPWVNAISGQEIIQLKPRDRYGSGVLEPVPSFAEVIIDTNADMEDLSEEFQTLEEDALPAPEGLAQAIDKISETRAPSDIDSNGNDLDPEVKSTRAWLNPRSIGISFLIEMPESGKLTVILSGGTYKSFPVTIKRTRPEDAMGEVRSEGSTGKGADYELTWFVRSEFQSKFEFNGAAFDNLHKAGPITPAEVLFEGRELNIDVRLRVRPQGNGTYLCTLSCVNRSKPSDLENTIYQAELNLEATSGSQFRAYPEAKRDYEMDLDDESALLLYENYPTFAIGHNAGVEWSREVGSSVNHLRLTSMPEYEAPSVTPDFTYPDGEMASLDMRLLSDLARKKEAIEELKRLLDAYKNWIDIQEISTQERPELRLKYRRSADFNIQECRRAAQRMQAGIQKISDDAQCYEAFRLANLAMLLQQYRSRLLPREVVFSGRVEVPSQYPSAELPEIGGQWRPFQIAFILSVLESVSDPCSADRDLVDLIFFPTGGGKTEAYLGVAAYVALLRRMKSPEDSGTAVLMRYTLRLLTTQQFLRAASLICALEVIRRDNEGLLGKNSYSIGAWLGGSVTPNLQAQALNSLVELRKRGEGAANPFLLLKCPWCATQLGPVKSSNHKSSTFFTAGYREVTTTPRRFRFYCPDVRCDFAEGLPLTVIDEEIYENPPTLLIGTVDKFAQLAWREGARSIFGISASGEQQSLPPELIIQDEFHLISGPLGSMVGLYEGVIEELCTTNVDGVLVVPKIISSTATIRRFRAQAKAIYARSKVALFPPPCIDASDSFFAVWARDDDGRLAQGRKYVGVNAPGLGSVQSAQVRVGSALAQAPMLLEESFRDPWWTNLWFFNSIRELSNTVSLFQSDIPNYLWDMRNRYGIEHRRLAIVNELTSRRQSHEIPQVLQELERKYQGMSNPKQKGVWDACLASNIIEVGIDIDRLSLMTIVSQPKSTAQYIQVSGRVGRSPKVKPGLVVTIYSSNRPRDLSHFEHFRSYHEKLYAQVEPTSVTPFAPPVITRALRGAVVAYLRMKMPTGSSPKQVDSDLLFDILERIKARAANMDLSEADLNFLDMEISKISKEWDVYRGDEWGDQSGSENGLLIAPTESKEYKGFRWVVPVSMRSVDASVELDVTHKYRDAQMEEAGT